MKIQLNHFSCYASHFLQENLVTSLTPSQRKVMAIASIAMACLAACLAVVYFMRRCGAWKRLQGDQIEQKHKPDGIETHLEELKDPKLKPDWINANPTVPLKDLGLTNFDMLEGFLKEHGKELKCLNLESVDRENDLNDEQIEQLMQYCPNLTQLIIDSINISDKALEHLKDIPLTSVNFSWCDNLTDKALEHLKGIPLTSVDFSWCNDLTDKALEHLKGMPLTTVNFRGSHNLTDKAFEHLKGMPLTSVYFSWCPNLTDKALDDLINHFALKGVQLKIIR